MPHDRLTVDKAPARDPQFSSRAQALQAIAQIVLGLAFLATLALWTLASAPEGLQQLLLFCLLRLAVLFCVGAASFRALCRRRPETPSLGSSLLSACGGSSSSSGALSPRSSLIQAALYLQLAWLVAELLLGSALLIFYPHFLGPSPVSGPSLPTSTLLTLLPLCCTAAMSGCFLFLQRLSRRRRQRGGCGSAALESGIAHSVSTSGSQQALQPNLHCSAASIDSGSQMDIICSPISEAGSYSSAASYGSCSYYARSSACGSVSGSGGAPSPTGHVRRGSEAAEANHEAAIQAACEIVLMEHQLDTNEFVMFVHKRLRPIKTRPEDKNKAAQVPGLLRDLITNSFTFQNDPQLASQLAASIQNPGGAAGGGAAAADDDASSGACSITFQTALAAGMM